MRCALGVGLIGVIGTALFYTQPVQSRLGWVVRAAVSPLLADGYSLDEPRVSLAPDGLLTLEDVVLRRPDGTVILGVRRAEAQLTPTALWRREVHATSLRADGVVLEFDEDEERVLDIVRAVGGPGEDDPDAPPWGGLPVSIVVDDVGLRDVWFVMRDPERVPKVAAKVVGLRGSLRMPRSAPEVHVQDAELDGSLLVPGPAGLAVDGDLAWLGEGLELDGVSLQLDRSVLEVTGEVGAFSQGGQANLTLRAESLDLADIATLTGARVEGAYTGEVRAHGPFWAMGIEAQLTAHDDPDQWLALREGSTLCLPVEGRAGTACDPDATEDDELRWSANLEGSNVHVERIVPQIGGPLKLGGKASGRGRGLSWPDGLVVEDVRWDGAEMDVYGIRVRDLGGDLALDGGVLHMSEVELEGVSGTVEGGGTLDLTNGEMSLDVHGDLDPSMLEDFEFTSLRGRGRYRATVKGRVYDEGAPLDIAGWAQMTPLIYEDSVRLERVEGPFTARVDHGVTDVSASLRGQGLWAYGATAADVELPDLRVKVDGGRVDVTGTLHSDEVRYSTWSSFREVTADVVALRTPERMDARAQRVQPASLVVDADVDVGPQEIFGLLGTHGDATVRLVDSDLRVDTELNWEDTPFVHAPGLRVNLDDLSVRLDQLLLQPTARQRWRLDRPLRLRVTDEGIADADVAFSSELGAMSFVGTWATEGEVDGRLRAVELELNAFAELFPELVSGLDGTLNLDTVVRGDASAPVVVGEIGVVDLFYDGLVRWLGVHGTFALEDDEVALDLAADAHGRPLLSLEGTAPVVSNLAAPGLSSHGSADLSLVLAPGGIDRLHTVSPSVTLPDGWASGVLTVSGDLHDPDLDLQLVADVELPGVRDDGRIEADISRREGLLRSMVDLYVGHDPVYLSQGTARTRMGEIMDWLLEGADRPQFDDVSLFADGLDVSAEVDELPVEILTAMLGYDLDLAAVATGTLHLQGDPLTPEFTSDLEVVGTIGDVPLDVGLEVEPEELWYLVDLDVGDGETSWLSAKGRVPLRVDLEQSVWDWGTGSYDVDVTGAGIPIGVVQAWDPEVQDATGVVAIEGHVGGALTAPEPELVATLDGGGLSYRPYGLKLRRLGVRAETSVDTTVEGAHAVRVNITDLAANTRPLNASIEQLGGIGNGRVEATGSGLITGDGLTDVRADVRFRDTWLLATDNNLLRVTGDVGGGGTYPQLRFDGDLAVGLGRFNVNVTELLEARDMSLDPAIVMHRGGVSRRVEEVSSSSWTDDLTVAIDLDLGRNTNTRFQVPVLDDLGQFGTSVTRADVTARLGGLLDVGWRNKDVYIRGDVDLLDGRVGVIRSQFDISPDSAIRFFGADYADPRLEVGGTMSLAGGELNMELGGTAQEPTFRLTSDDFGSDAALFSILFTGQAPDELSANQGRAAIEAVSGLLLDSILGGVNLGSVSVEADGTIRLGLPVYRTVFVESSFDPVARLNENTVTVAAEWSALPQLILEGAYGDREVWGNVFWEIRFDDLKRKASDGEATER